MKSVLIIFHTPSSFVCFFFFFQAQFLGQGSVLGLVWEGSTILLILPKGQKLFHSSLVHLYTTHNNVCQASYLLVLPRVLWDPSASPPTGVLSMEWLTEQTLLALGPSQAMLLLLLLLLGNNLGTGN